MESIKIIINLCTHLLTVKINLFGYDISLMALLVLGGCIFLLSFFIFGLFK